MSDMESKTVGYIPPKQEEDPQMQGRENTDSSGEDALTEPQKQKQ